jgi:hypothetical protein
LQVNVRAILVVMAVLAAPVAAAPRELALSRQGTAATTCVAGDPCGDDLARSMAGFQLVVHHRDTPSDRVMSLRIGAAVDVGLGLVALDAGAPKIAMVEGTLDDHSVAVVVSVQVGRDAQLTVCRLGAPACTPQVKAQCADDGCGLSLARGLLKVQGDDGAQRFRIKKSAI